MNPLRSLLSIPFLAVSLTAQQGYQQPPEAIRKVLDAPQPPQPFLSPAKDRVLLVRRNAYPPLSVVSEPLLRLGGIRLNPRTNAERSYTTYFTSFTLKELKDGREIPVALPENGRAGAPSWNPAGTRFAFTNEAANGVELWLGEASTGRTHRLEGFRLNPALGRAVNWLPDGQTLLVKAVPEKRGAAPEAPPVPPGPRIQSTSGPVVASSTYETQDVLRTPYDMDLFDYYAQSQLLLARADGSQLRALGAPGVYRAVVPAPDGIHVLVTRLHRPYSVIRTLDRFPKNVEVWDLDGRITETVAQLPLSEQVPIHGEPTGPRDFEWVPTEPATLQWAEALDGGDPRAKAEKRDKVMLKELGQPAVEFGRTKDRYQSLEWLETGQQGLLREHDEDTHWSRTWIVDRKTANPRLLWDMSSDERYRNPGQPMWTRLKSGAYAIEVIQGAIHLTSQGASPEGDRPFLDRLDLKTLRTERLFRCDREGYEHVLALLDAKGSRFLTSRESPSDYPNLHIRTLTKKLGCKPAEGEALWTSVSAPFTDTPNPVPELTALQKRLVTYKRSDGVDLSFTLYLPPDYKAGTRLPTILWAYPLDYTSASTAGQVGGSPRRYNLIYGSSVIFLALHGYAVLDQAAMPVIGDPKTAYDTFLEQIEANAKAAIDKAVDLGVTDPDRVGVIGHSHGALMTANFMAHSELFRAGIARSGAYNHTIRPFGFQNEQRTLWQAKDTYLKISPLWNADLIKKPLLLIHGEMDQNPGTVPFQSEKLFEALRGLGATTRLVMLPYENHGYIARESVDHVLWEMTSWFDQYVKNAPPRSAGPQR